METTSSLEESMMENMPENGVQRLADVIVEQRSEEDTPMLHLELEDSEDANIHEISMQSEEMEQEVEDMVNNMCIYIYIAHITFFFKSKINHYFATFVTLYYIVFHKNQFTFSAIPILDQWL